MASIIALALLTLALQRQPTCSPGQVVDVSRGQDYTVTLCGDVIVGLRGVEAPLYTAVSGINRGMDTAELLGAKDITPEALRFLTERLVGKKVTLVYDGYRIGDRVGRQYAYVYLPDKSLVNAEMIRRGYGYAERQGAHPMRAQFFALEEVAHRAKVGVWNQ
jgi:endonuclease YncB( thermonuclease family)